MTLIRDFVGTLTVNRKSLKEIKETVKKMYGNMALKTTQIYDIMNLRRTGSGPEGLQHQEASQKLGFRHRYRC